MKKLLCFMITAALVFCTVPFVYGAGETAAEGVCGAQGDNVVWSLDKEGWLVISGEGAMADYEWNGSPWYDSADVRVVEIKDGVTSLGDYAFYTCGELTHVILPETLASIGKYAFCSCTGLTEMKIPESVSEIGSGAFYGCEGLTEMVIPEKVTAIGSYTFCGCEGLTSVRIPGSVTTLGGSAFSGCSGLTAVALPEDITSIASAVFSGCEALTEMEIPDKVVSVGRNAFYGCAGLTQITLPEGCETLDESAFEGCAALTGIVVPAGTGWIGQEAIPAHTMIYGAEDSFAQRWAEENGRAFTVRSATKLTMTVPSVVSERSVPVCGFANPGAEVTVLLNDEPAAAVRASANGKWNVLLRPADAGDGDSFTVKASVSSAEKTITRTASVRYASGAATFRSLTMEHNFYTVTVTGDELNTAKRNVTLAPEKPFFFRVEIDNSENVRSLFVRSTKDGVAKSLRLLYEETSDCWLADGFFDGADASYVPGALTVEGVDKNGDRFDSGVTVKMNFLLTPAGYAYEAVRSNKLEGVSAAVYNRDEAGHETLWNAEGAEQFNPVTTLPDGSFSWAVTKGTWQIRLTKDGYTSAASEWMTVPPVHDQVLLPMVTTQAPEVRFCEIHADGAEITFSQYMDIATVNTETVAFDGCTGSIVPLDAEETEEGSGVFYARAFRFTPAVPLTGSVAVTYDGVKNYAGIAMESFTAEYAVTDRTEYFTATDAVAIGYGETAEIAVQADNAAGKTVSVSADSGVVSLSADTLTLDENGGAVLTVTGRMTGTARIAFTLDGTALTAGTDVTVALPEPEVLIGDVNGDGAIAPADARLALRIAVGLEACEEGSAMFLAADINRNGAIAPDDARMILRASVGLEQLT